MEKISHNHITLKIVLSLISVFVLGNLSAQVYSDRVVDEERVAELEEMKKKEYPYLLPLFGKNVIEKGFDIPYSAGVSVQYIQQESDVLINNLLVGFNNGDPYELDPFVDFSKAVSRSNGLNFRPDFWLFPFLNVYGVFARSSTSTEVDVELTLPNQNGYEPITTFETELDFDAITTGFGITPTVGIAGAWLALDMSFTWTDTEAIDDPVYTFVLGPRVGKSFYLGKPERNISLWVGGFRVAIDRTTEGSIPFADIFEDPGSLEEKINTGLNAVNQKQNEVEDWFESLSPRDQIINRPKYELLTRTLSRANEFLFRLDDARQRALDSTLQYTIDKKQRNLWNFIVGTQYQHNKHWMLRAEVGFLGTRTQFIGGLQYRFGL